jgi:hypothetical protein
MRVPEGMTPAKLRLIADWFDTYDRLALAHFDLLQNLGVWEEAELEPVRQVTRGTEIQNDLRAWANALELHRGAETSRDPNHFTGKGDT